MGENERTTDHAILTHNEADELRRSTTDTRSLAPQTESKQNWTDTKEKQSHRVERRKNVEADKIREKDQEQEKRTRRRRCGRGGNGTG